MRRDGFLNLFFKSQNSDREIIGNRFGQFAVKDIKDFKQLTALIDYDCRFDKKGVCKQNKGSNNIMCCCGGCKYTMGYLKTISYFDLPTYTKLFNNETGFWRNDGCSLPRELRSVICLGHNCKSHVTDAEHDLIDLISGLVNHISFQDKIIIYGKKYELDPYHARLDNLTDHLRSRLEAK
jgi:hypothetical protein